VNGEFFSSLLEAAQRFDPNPYSIVHIRTPRIREAWATFKSPFQASRPHEEKDRQSNESRPSRVDQGLRNNLSNLLGMKVNHFFIIRWMVKHDGFLDYDQDFCGPGDPLSMP